MIHLATLVLFTPFQDAWHWAVEWTYWPESGKGYGFFSSTGGTPLFATGLFCSVLAIYKQHNCKAHWWCPAWSHHKVDGTTASVCHFHHTLKMHEKLFRRHQEKHPDRLAHGESHSLAKVDSAIAPDTT